MQDTKLFTEVTHALVNGIQTTSKAKLDTIYRQFDRAFPQAEELTVAIEQALDTVIALTDIHNTSIMKSYEFYALLLAIIHTHTPQSQLQAYVKLDHPVKIDRNAALTNLSILADVLDNGDSAHEYKEFVDASSSRTNVASQRQLRFVWFCRALMQPTL
ncbi:hypothetical protein AWC23_25685 [Mycobacterium saskatchewanense]|uniref:Uncharacterized protein n=2 Tax=Mycobacterium saskatchewanense TaxID=220927 RepID=A0AAJ3NK34_9MYCO|nr:hypothetical protein AWC23_25685 [Mycobacterium saskatchewanense]